MTPGRRAPQAAEVLVSLAYAERQTARGTS
jgi:hypothetical protein